MMMIFLIKKKLLKNIEINPYHNLIIVEKFFIYKLKNSMSKEKNKVIYLNKILNI